MYGGGVVMLSPSRVSSLFHSDAAQCMSERKGLTAALFWHTYNVEIYGRVVVFWGSRVSEF